MGALNNKKLIVIDPGHGGTDPGAAANGLKEKDITLAIAQKLARRLGYYNTEIKMTRVGDTFVSLSDRAKFANKMGADLFISIHCDANAKAEASGATSYRHTGASEQTKAIQNLIHIEYANVLRLNDVLDRGCRTANFAVLRETIMPAALIENGFITNAKDAAKLKTDKFLEALAEGIETGIVRALSLEKQQKDTLETDIKTLQESNGVIGSPAYWLENARPGKTVNGEYAAALISKMAEEIRRLKA